MRTGDGHLGFQRSDDGADAHQAARHAEAHRRFLLCRDSLKFHIPAHQVNRLREKDLHLRPPGYEPDALLAALSRRSNFSVQYAITDGTGQHDSANILHAMQNICTNHATTVQSRHDPQECKIYPQDRRLAGSSHDGGAQCALGFRIGATVG